MADDLLSRLANEALADHRAGATTQSSESEFAGFKDLPD